MEKVKIEDIMLETDAMLTELFTGNDEGFAHFGDGKYLMPKKYKEHADKIRQMKVREDDYWVVTLPQAGATLIQEMLWLLDNNLNFEKAALINLDHRYSFLEMSSLITQKSKDEMIKKHEECAKMIEFITTPAYTIAETASSPRYIRSQLPFSLLPPNLLDTAKVIYVARDPRDVAVSLYHHSKVFMPHGYNGDFSTFWDLFKRDQIVWCPYFSHIKEAWTQRSNPNMMFLFYEDISKNLEGAAKKVAKFMGKDYSDGQFKKLCEYLDGDNKNSAENFEDLVIKGVTRKDKVGGWKQYFDYDMSLQAEKWMKRNLTDTDVKFPDME